MSSTAGEHAERRSWNDLDAKTQTSLLALMPKDVRARVRRGDMPSEDEVEELVRCYVLRRRLPAFTHTSGRCVATMISAFS